MRSPGTERKNPHALLQEGLGALPEAFQEGFSAFCQEYLETPEKKVPFGGRASVLEALDTWLSKGTCPHALLVAEAGRGKSALLTRWVAQLSEQGRARVVFVPLSLRFGTATRSAALGILGARLRALSPQEAMPSGAPGALEAEIEAQLQKDVSDEEPPLLVVFDGLDEASDWSCPRELPLPSSLGRRIKVLASARRLANCDEAGWREKLGWSEENTASLSLPPLTLPELADVLAQMGEPLQALGARADLVRELFRLCEGDPLLLRLYVEELHEQGAFVSLLTPEGLAYLTPGLEGYLARWWEEQRRLWGETARQEEQRVQTLLRLLACSLGPLSRADLLALLGLGGAEVQALSQALYGIRRFVVGDGEAQGYVFSHPRLGSHFREQLPEEEKASWQQRFLRYGEEQLSALRLGRLEPKAVSPYLIRYYGAHLEHSRAPSVLLEALVSPGWQRAWESLEGTPEGFLVDLERAWRRAEQDWLSAKGPAERGEALARQCRAALVLSSIRSLSDKFHPELLVELVEEGLMAPAVALSYAMNMSPLQEDNTFYKGPGALAPYLSAAQVRKAIGWVTASAAHAYSPRMTSFPPLVARLAALGHAGEAMDVVRQQPKGRRPWALLEALSHFPERLQAEAIQEARRCTDDPEMLLRIALQCKGRESEALIQEALAVAQDHSDPTRIYDPSLFAQAGATAQALKYARAKISSHANTRSHALAGVIPYLQGEEQRAALEEWFASEQEFFHHAPWTETQNTFTILPQQLSGDLGSRVIAFARKHLTRGLLLGNFVRLARQIPELLPEALALVRASSAPQKHNLLFEIAKTMPEAQREEALAALHETGQLVHYRQLLPKEERHVLLLQIVERTRTIHDEGGQSYALLSLAEHLSEEERGEVLGWALRAARREKDSVFYTMFLVNAGLYFSKEEQPLMAREALEALLLRLQENRYVDENEVQTLLSLVSEEEQRSFLQRVISLLPTNQNMSLASLPCHAAPVLSGKLVMETWESLCALPKGPEAWVLCRMAPYLPQEWREEGIEWALNALLRSSQPPIAIESLAPHLSEPLLRRALTTSSPSVSSWSQGALLSRLAHLSGSSEALSRCLAIKDKHSRTRTLKVLFPNLAEPEQRESVEELLADLLDHKEPKIKGLTELAPHLVRLGYGPRLLKEAREWGSSSWSSVQLMVAVARCLPASARREVLLEALAIGLEQRRDVQYWYSAAVNALLSLREHLEELEPAALYPLWTAALRAMARKSRGDLMAAQMCDAEDDFSLLAPVLAHLGGEAALARTAEALVEVAAWFP